MIRKAPTPPRVVFTGYGLDFRPIYEEPWPVKTATAVDQVRRPYRPRPEVCGTGRLIERHPSLDEMDDDQ